MPPYSSILTEQNYISDLVKAEPERQISRTVGTIATANVAAVVPRFTVLGIVTSTGKWVPLAPGASDGSQVAAGILLDGGGGTGLQVGSANAVSADVPNCVILQGLAAVNEAFIVWPSGVNATQQAAALAQLAIRNLVALQGA